MSTDPSFTAPAPAGFAEMHDEMFERGQKALARVYTHAVIDDGTVLTADRDATGPARSLWEMLDSDHMSKSLNTDLWKTGRGGKWTHVGFAREESARLAELGRRMKVLRVRLLITAEDFQRLNGALRVTFEDRDDAWFIPELNCSVLKG